MPDVKSPFLVFQNFISPLLCDTLLDKLRVVAPLVNEDTGYPEKLERFHAESEGIIFDKFKPLIPNIESYYNLKYRGTEKLLFQYFPVSNTLAETLHCENSQYVRKKWVKLKDRDLTGILWLKDYNSEVPIELATEVYGGKLEFPQYKFSLQPQRRTLIIYPAYPNFLTATSQILIGDLYCVRFHIAAEGIWLYQPTHFGGTYPDWFKEYA